MKCISYKRIHVVPCSLFIKNSINFGTCTISLKSSMALMRV